MLQSLSLYIGNKLIFRFFDSAFIERAIAPNSDMSGSI